MVEHDVHLTCPLLGLSVRPLFFPPPVLSARCLYVPSRWLCFSNSRLAFDAVANLLCVRRPERAGVQIPKLPGKREEGIEVCSKLEDFG